MCGSVEYSDKVIINYADFFTVSKTPLILCFICFGDQGWRSGESTRLPPMWPGFDSRSRCHRWVEFVVDSLLALRGFLRVLRYSYLHKNQHFRIPSGISTQRATLCRCHSKFQCIYFIYYLFPHFSMCGSVEYSDKVRTVRTISRCLKSCYSLLNSTLVDA